MVRPFKDDEKLGKESNLSEEESTAIGLNVMNDLIKEAFQKQNLTETEKEEALEEIRDLISKEFPSNHWNPIDLYDRKKSYKKNGVLHC